MDTRRLKITNNAAGIRIVRPAHGNQVNIAPKASFEGEFTKAEADSLQDRKLANGAPELTVEDSGGGGPGALVAGKSLKDEAPLALTEAEATAMNKDDLRAWIEKRDGVAPGSELLKSELVAIAMTEPMAETQPA